MNIDRQYQGKSLNWSLIRDFMRDLEKHVKGLTENQDRRNSWFTLFGEPAKPKHDTYYEGRPGYEARTYSQQVSVQSGDEFLTFLKGTSEPIDSVDIYIECIRHEKYLGPSSERPPYFHLSWASAAVSVSFGRLSTKDTLALLEKLEALFQLTPAAAPSPRNEASSALIQKRTAFVAHSFDDQGRSYAFQLTRFLSLIGFEVATGEGYSPESVSKKVRRRLKAQEIAIAVITQRDDLTWLIQEATAADFSHKPLILLLEEGAEFKGGILGDLEFIRFGKGRISDAFSPILEGLRELGLNFGGGNA